MKFIWEVYSVRLHFHGVNFLVLGWLRGEKPEAPQHRGPIGRLLGGEAAGLAGKFIV